MTLMLMIVMDNSRACLLWVQVDGLANLVMKSRLEPVMLSRGST